MSDGFDLVKFAENGGLLEVETEYEGTTFICPTPNFKEQGELVSGCLVRTEREHLLPAPFPANPSDLQIERYIRPDRGFVYRVPGSGVLRTGRAQHAWLTPPGGRRVKIF